MQFDHFEIVGIAIEAGLSIMDAQDHHQRPVHHQSRSSRGLRRGKGRRSKKK